MSFDVDPRAYDRFMGRYSGPLAVQFAAFAGVSSGRVLDVGCGPGALTGELVRRLGASAVEAVDPSPSFVAAIGERFPGVHMVPGSAERLPFADAGFDAALAQLVVHFMADPAAGIAEMVRVVRPGGVVAACVWDHAGGRGPLSLFWAAAHELDPDVDDESNLAGAREGHLGELFGAAGLHEIEPAELTVSVEYESFDDWWQPYTLGVGRGGAYCASLSEERRAALRERCRRGLPDPPFTFAATAWAARGIR